MTRKRPSELTDGKLSLIFLLIAVVCLGLASSIPVNGGSWWDRNINKKPEITAEQIFQSKMNHCREYQWAFVKETADAEEWKSLGANGMNDRINKFCERRIANELANR